MNNKIKLAYLIDTIDSDKGGTEKQIINIIKRLNGNYFDFTLVCLYESTWMKNNVLPCNVISLAYNGFFHLSFPSVLFKYLSVLKQNRFDIVQAFFEDSLLVGSLGKILSKDRQALIICRRDLGLGADETRYYWVLKKIRPYIFHYSDGIVVNANAIKNHLSNFEGAPLRKITVIVNGVDIEEPPQEPPVLFRTYQAAVWIGIVANLKPIKRIDVLLRALALIKASAAGIMVRTVILGEGRLKAELSQLAEKLGVADRVHFVGAVGNVSDYLHSVDIGVLCSDKEGLSNAILEYMSCGLPVVATSAGGNNELVDQTNGACIPVGDHIALAQELAKLISSSDLRKELGLHSLEKMKQMFSWEKVMYQWNSYYQSLVQDLNFGDNQTDEFKA